MPSLPPAGRMLVSDGRIPFSYQGTGLTTPAQIISRKRDGEELTDTDIDGLMQRYVRDELPDYQMSAFAMAVYFQGMTDRETVALTRAMLDSGVKLQWPCTSPAKVDKHSTGGLGDKVSLILAPVLACCGLHIPMLSGRGLGLTGGTLDKLESIHGFRTNLSVAEIQSQTDSIGCVITGASEELAPADKKLYALRDVTGTVPSIPLITASILSKKLAENLDALVLDVKFGSGAFMKTIEEARKLARRLVDVGTLLGVPTSALITDMNQPLGRMVGNALEVGEAIDTLVGNGPIDVTRITFSLGNELLRLQGIVHDDDAGTRLQQAQIASGQAVEKFWRMVEMQGGLRDPEFDLAPAHDLLSTRCGYVASVDNVALGHAMIDFGGGRRIITDNIDHGVGLEVLVRVGDQVEIGQPLLRVYTHDQPRTTTLSTAVTIVESEVPALELVRERIGGEHA